MPRQKSQSKYIHMVHRGHLEMGIRFPIPNTGMEASKTQERKQPGPDHLPRFSLVHQAVNMTTGIDNQVGIVAEETRLMNDGPDKLIVWASG